MPDEFAEAQESVMARIAELEALARDMLGTFIKTSDGHRARVGQVQIARWQKQLDRTTLAEQRRLALAGRAAQARRDPCVAELVKLMLASRRNRQSGGNVIRLDGRADG